MVRDVCKDGVKVLRSLDYDKSLQLTNTRWWFIRKFSHQNIYSLAKAACTLMLWVSIHLREKNLCVYSYYEVSIYRYKFVLFIKVLPDVFSFPNTPNVINTFHSTLLWDENAREKFQHYWQKLEWTMSFVFICHREKTWCWWHCKLPAFSAYNTNMDLIHISDIENQISVIWFPYCNCACVQVNV